MIRAIGVDIVNVERVAALHARYGRRLMRKLLGPREQTAFQQRADKSVFLAGRFAAKEAAIKALGEYLHVRPHLCAMEILNDATGRPDMFLPTSVQDRLAGARLHVSISHERTHAVAIVIIEEER
jgi:holo-[acyl-carrier protein] synthase